MHKLSFFNLTLSFLSLLGFWLAMSGIFDFVHITMGVVTVVGVMMLNYQLKQHHFFEDDMDDLSELRFGRAVYYFFWMIYQIIVAGFHVLTVIIRPKMPIEPTLITFKVDLPSAHAKMILGNSITLTPGTLTIEIEDDTFTVHAIDSKSFAGIMDDSMPRQVLSLFSSKDRPVIREFKIVNQNT